MREWRSTRSTVVPRTISEQTDNEAASLMQTVRERILKKFMTTR